MANGHQHGDITWQCGRNPDHGELCWGCAGAHNSAMHFEEIMPWLFRNLSGVLRQTANPPTEAHEVLVAPNEGYAMPTGKTTARWVAHVAAAIGDCEANA